MGFLFLFPGYSFAQKAKKESSFKENHTPFGKRKKERKNQKGTAGKISRGGSFTLFKKRQKSAGNADAFASNSAHGGRGFIYKLFHPNSGSPKNASLRKTKPGKVQNREQHRLFRRIFTKNKGTHERIQNTNRKERTRKRKRGNEVFADKKH
ncbi:MAG TPA: hypothetical protein VNZ49_10445 [Bacteroidia bacterium]|nr:hypothetical protein [Bacteroidia bacterium]